MGDGGGKGFGGSLGGGFRGDMETESASCVLFFGNEMLKTDFRFLRLRDLETDLGFTCFL
jgi:hypothetical protein